MGDSRLVNCEYRPLFALEPERTAEFKSVPVQRIVETDYDKALRELNEEFPGVRNLF